MTADPEILPIFLEEAEGYLKILQDPHGDPQERKRAAHNLKGAAGLVGLSSLQQCGARLERMLRGGSSAAEVEAEVALARGLLQQARHDGGEVDASTRETVQAGSAAAEKAALEASGSWDPETAQILRQCFTEEAHDHLEHFSRVLMTLENAHRKDEEGGEEDGDTLLEELMRSTHTLKGAAATVDMKPVGEAAHRLEDYLQDLQQRRSSILPEEVDRLLEAADIILSMVDSGEDEAAQISGLKQCHSVLTSKKNIHAGDRRSGQDRRDGPPRQLRVAVNKLDGLMRSTSELVLDRTRIDRRVEEMRRLARELGLIRQGLHAALSAAGAQPQTIQKRLSEVEVELTDATSNLERTVSALNQDIEGLRRSTRALQEHLTQVRMMPLRWLYTRLQRPMREMARELGKQVELNILDEATEMDRALVEQITDPLIHLVRNAVVHGIEDPLLRRAAGKPATGKIELTARHQGNVIFMEVRDDGAGIDPALLCQTIRQSGAMGAAALDVLQDDELLEIIFTTGFTTHHLPDQLAGRGMGLNVVRQNISRLGGDIRVSSTPGQGTRFSIQMPMTTAIAQALLFKVGDQVYAIPVVHVSETLLADPKDLQQVGAHSLLQTREESIPLLHLHLLLGTSTPPPLERPPQKEALLPVIILELGERRFGITCSRVVGPREIVLKGLGSLLAPHPFLAAATVSGSNKVQFVLEVGFLARAVSLGRSRRGRNQTGPGYDGSAPSAPVVVNQPPHPNPPPFRGEGSCPAILGRDPARTEQILMDKGPGKADPPKIATPTAGNPAARMNPPSVLLADDSRTVREVVGHLLHNAGYVVDASADGRDAWDRLQIRPYDLLLTDLEMPRLHGLDLIARCRQAPAMASMPIVVLTSKTSTDNRRLAKQAGADDFLTKPVNQRHLLHRLDALLLHSP